MLGELTDIGREVRHYFLGVYPRVLIRLTVDLCAWGCFA